MRHRFQKGEEVRVWEIRGLKPYKYSVGIVWWIDHLHFTVVHADGQETFMKKPLAWDESLPEIYPYKSFDPKRPSINLMFVTATN